MKYFLLAINLVAIAVLGWLTVQNGQMDKPGQPLGFHVGMAIGNLIMPLLFSIIAGFIKRSFADDKRYDWRMFYIFLFSFTFISILGQWGDYRHKTMFEEEKTEVGK